MQVPIFASLGHCVEPVLSSGTCGPFLNVSFKGACCTEIQRKEENQRESPQKSMARPNATRSHMFTRFFVRWKHIYTRRRKKKTITKNVDYVFSRFLVCVNDILCCSNILWRHNLFILICIFSHSLSNVEDLIPVKPLLYPFYKCISFPSLFFPSLSLPPSLPSHIIRSQITQKGLSQVTQQLPSNFHIVVWIWRLSDIVIWYLTRTSSILSFALDYAVIYVSLVPLTYLNKSYVRHKCSSSALRININLFVERCSELQV